MKRPILLLIFTMAVLCGCKTGKKTRPTLPIIPIETKTETKIVHTETIDTVLIEIPAQSSEKTSLEGYSHLETDYAESDAQINPDGTLHHTLNNKPTKHPVSVKNTADTVRIARAVPYEVPRKLTPWQSFRINAFWWLVGAVAVAGAAGWWVHSRKKISHF